jgi:hypothetical protein
MAIQRNVQQQAAETRAAIKRAAAVGEALPQWLRSALQQHSLEPQAGLLVRYFVVPEQEGDLHTGIWLTDSEEFWEFDVMVSRETQEVLDIEEFTNATASYAAVAALPGTGPSFGYLARQVLHETRDA